MSGRRVKGREAIACDAVGALYALAATGTLICRGRRLTSSAMMLPVSPSDQRIGRGCPARRAGSAPQGRSPVRARPGAAERSGAALIQYGSTRQRGAIQAFLCCVLAALGSAAADCLYVSSVLPLKISDRRRQSETLNRTALTVMAGSHDLADTRCRCTVRLSLTCTDPLPQAAVFLVWR